MLRVSRSGFRVSGFAYCQLHTAYWVWCEDCWNIAMMEYWVVDYYGGNILSSQIALRFIYKVHFHHPSILHFNFASKFTIKCPFDQLVGVFRYVDFARH